MQVQNNIASINAARNQGIETGKLKKSLEKLSSGFRIVQEMMQLDWRSRKVCAAGSTA